MDKDKLYELKAEASQLKPIINIGKNGVTAPVVEEIRKHLKANRMIKMKLLKSSREEKDTTAIAEELAQATGSQVIEIRGNSVVLYK
ncbi:YhbY family RNA-binding protein [Methanomethylovorans sp.]|uniref:YhbY family RNA-binding protein n=1 Tax=Methanomethylovorans sp. TaxID=2758717 RepID=UPI00351C7990